MKTKKNKTLVIKGVLFTVISITTKVLETFVNAKSVSVKERVLLDHLSGSSNTSLVETVYKYGDSAGTALNIVSLVTLLIAIGFISIVVKNKYFGGKSK